MHMPEERSDSNSCAFLRKSADIGGDVGFCLLAACCCLLNAVFEHFGAGWNRGIFDAVASFHGNVDRSEF